MSEIREKRKEFKRQKGAEDKVQKKQQLGFRKLLNKELYFHLKKYGWVTAKLTEETKDSLAFRYLVSGWRCISLQGKQRFDQVFMQLVIDEKLAKEKKEVKLWKSKFTAQLSGLSICSHV